MIANESVTSTDKEVDKQTGQSWFMNSIQVATSILPHEQSNKTLSSKAIQAQILTD